MNDVSSSRFASVRNPLTVIAVFAGLAEVTATIALPQLDIAVQRTFVWFVMCFPTLLVLLFFLVLWKKHHILYAPSDFSDEKNFMRYWHPAATKDDELVDGESVDSVVLGPDLPKSIDVVPSDPKSIKFNEFRENSEKAQKFVVKKLSKRFSLSFATDMALGGEFGARYDAIANSPSGPVLVEVKLLRNRVTALMTLRRELDRAASISYRIPQNELSGVRLILAFVFERDDDFSENADLTQKMISVRDSANLPISVEFEFFSLQDLENGNTP